jgi:hypothetical protein
MNLSEKGEEIRKGRRSKPAPFANGAKGAAPDRTRTAEIR